MSNGLIPIENMTITTPAIDPAVMVTINQVWMSNAVKFGIICLVIGFFIGFFTGYIYMLRYYGSQK